MQGSLTFEAEVLELVAFGVGDVGGLLAVVLGRQLQLLLPVAGAAAGRLLPGCLGTDQGEWSFNKGYSISIGEISQIFASVRLIEFVNHRGS